MKYVFVASFDNSDMIMVMIKKFHEADSTRNKKGTADSEMAFAPSLINF